MSISLRDNKTRRLTLNAVMIVLAMMLSYLEAILPLNLLLPIPGFRLGLANVVVMLAFTLLSPLDAAIISGVRILLMSLLFGTVTSLWFSALGGLFAYAMLAICVVGFRRCSYFGASVLCAAAHNCGQILAAATLFGSAVILSYLPILLLAKLLQLHHLYSFRQKLDNDLLNLF